MAQNVCLNMLLFNIHTTPYISVRKYFEFNRSEIFGEQVKLRSGFICIFTKRRKKCNYQNLRLAYKLAQSIFGISTVITNFGICDVTFGK